MDIEKLNHWLSLVANIGVLIGLVFLILEISQTNRIAIVSAEYDFRDSAGLINESVYSNAEVADFIYYINNNDEEILQEGERLRAFQWAFRLLNLWIAAESAYQNEISSEMVYNNIINDIRDDIHNTSPAMRKIWREAISIYPALDSTGVFLNIDQLLREYGE